MITHVRNIMIFALIAKHGTFSKAAEELGITTSAVSQQLRALEDHLDAELFNRTTRKLSLTEAGESLLPYAQQIISAANTGIETLAKNKSGLAGSMRIFAPAGVAKELILPALYPWLDNNEGIDLQLFTGHKIDFVEDRIDIAFELLEKPVGKALTTVKQVLVASPEYILEHKITSDLATAKNHKLIRLGDPNSNSTYLNGKRRDSRLGFGAHLSSDSPETAIEMAIQGLGILLADETLVGQLVADGKLVVVMPECELPDLSLCVKISKHSDKVPEKVNRCLDVVEAYFAKK